MKDSIDLRKILGTLWNYAEKKYWIFAGIATLLKHYELLRTIDKKYECTAVYAKIHTLRLLTRPFNGFDRQVGISIFKIPTVGL